MGVVLWIQMEHIDESCRQLDSLDNFHLYVPLDLVLVLELFMF